MPKLNNNIKKLAKKNTDLRREILTNQHKQIVLTSIESGDEISEESHDVAQVLVFVKGDGEATLDGERNLVGKGSWVVVPAGVRHNVNTSDDPLKLFTIYSPPEEEPGTLHRTEAEALAAEHG